eukprot:5951217-Alexandrium_andersonii.AAC.1
MAVVGARAAQRHEHCCFVLARLCTCCCFLVLMSRSLSSFPLLLAAYSHSLPPHSWSSLLLSPHTRSLTAG